MITPAQRAEIRRLFYGEHWKIGTIAAQLGHGALADHRPLELGQRREDAGTRGGRPRSWCRPARTTERRGEPAVFTIRAKTSVRA